MKKQNIIIIIVFGALIFGLGLLGWLTPDQAFSENENRYLQELPKLSEDTMVNGDFGDEVEDYLSDQFWQRDSWTAARSKMKMLLRKKDFFTRCEEKGLAAENLTFMPVPTPGYTLRDKLPRYATLFDEDAVFDEMKLVFDDQLVDLRTDFAKAAESEQLYYRTDHHWKTAGALLGYQCYRAAMGLSIPAAADYTVERYEGFRGTLYSKVLDKNAATDTVELYHRKGDAALTVTYDNADHASCYDMEKLQQKDMYEVFFGGNWPTVTITGGPENGRRLLVLKDSYANALLPFAAADYEKIVAVDLRYYLGSLSELMEQEGITDVLVLYSTSAFMSDTKIDRLALAK